MVSPVISERVMKNIFTLLIFAMFVCTSAVCKPDIQAVPRLTNELDSAIESFYKDLEAGNKGFKIGFSMG